MVTVGKVIMETRAAVVCNPVLVMAAPIITGAQIMTGEITQIPEAVLEMKTLAGKVERALPVCKAVTEAKDQKDMKDRRIE